MKMKPEHYEKLRAEVLPILQRVAVLHTIRIRWYALYHVGLNRWISDNLYSYLDDTHIDTALKAISKEAQARDA